MNTWLVTVSPPIVGCDDHYIAYSKEDPTLNDEWRFIEEQLITDTFDDYSYLLHIEDDFDDDEDNEDAIGEAYYDTLQNWIEGDCDVIVEQMDEDKIKEDYGKLEIIYDER